MPGDSEGHQNGLHQLDEHFSNLVAEVRDYAIFLLDPTGHVRSWNAGAAHIKGYAANEIIGQHFSKFYTADAIATGWPDEELRRAQAEGRFEDEGWRLRKDGSRFWANVVITPLFDDDRKLRGFLKITRALTERKQAVESLRESEERFRMLVEGVRDYAIFRLDIDGRVSTWNAGAERIKGYKAGEIIGRHFSVFFNSEDLVAGKPAKELETAQREGRAEDEGWRVRKDGSLFWANVVLTALRRDDGELVGYAKITRDMTEKRKADALELADRQKNEFLAMLAHELRNPLAPISNGLQLLKLPGIEQNVVREATEMMERQLYHLVRLVDDLLDVSRIVTGKMHYNMEPVELATVIHRAIEESQPMIDARGHELMLSLPAKSIIVDADVHRLAQVFSNLLLNAAKYTDEPNQIWLQVERDDGDAVIRVRDSGIGIAPEILPNIFSLFVQADHSLDRTRGGLGIGLSIVKRIVDLHRGTVTAFSAGAGQGAEFVVRLPVSQSLAATAEAKSNSSSAKGPRRRILVVDDNADAALTVGTLLRAWGHDVHTVFNGAAALEEARSFRPEIVLLDIGMPGMSGYDVARELRAHPIDPGTIIVALTGYGRESDRERSFEAGFDYHLTKPPDPTTLESLLALPTGSGRTAGDN
jgi:PAS domain S-box-containing protein